MEDMWRYIKGVTIYDRIYVLDMWRNVEDVYIGKGYKALYMEDNRQYMKI